MKPPELGNVYITDGMYRIVEIEGVDYFGISIQHHCPKGIDYWVGHIYQARHRGWVCWHCSNAPPDGIQACFWFLKSNEVK